MLVALAGPFTSNVSPFSHVALTFPGLSEQAGMLFRWPIPGNASCVCGSAAFACGLHLVVWFAEGLQVRVGVVVSVDDVVDLVGWCATAETVIVVLACVAVAFEDARSDGRPVLGKSIATCAALPSSARHG